MGVFAEVVEERFLALMQLFDNSDAPPTTQAIAALTSLEAQLR